MKWGGGCATQGGCERVRTGETKLVEDKMLSGCMPFATALNGIDCVWRRTVDDHNSSSITLWSVHVRQRKSNACTEGARQWSEQPGRLAGARLPEI